MKIEQKPAALRTKPSRQAGQDQLGLDRGQRCPPHKPIFARIGPAIGGALLASGRFLARITRKFGTIALHNKLFHRAVLALGSVTFVLMIVGISAFFLLSKDTLPADDIDLWQVNRPASVLMVDVTGAQVGIRGSHYGTPVPLSELPPYVVDAFVATEDRRFFKHNGLDFRGLTRAMVNNTKAGYVVEGGSTITQQLAKNLFLTSERSYFRKLKEAQISWWMEARYSKDEILSLYLNRTYLGAGAYGIEAAARVYFNKSARDLTLTEAAMIAGLPKAPSALSPVHNMEGAIKRSNEVIDNMVETGTLNVVTAQIAKRVPPALDMKSLDDSAGYFFDYAMQEAEKILGKIDVDIIVSTTLNVNMQRQAEQSIAAYINETNIAKGAEQAALVSYENDGRILAMVGGRNYAESQFNRATMAERQPGSVFKPFVYLAALESGMSPRTLVVDRPVKIGNWEPANYSGQFEGPMRLSQALSKSVNSVAVQVTEDIGREKVIEVAKRLGIRHKLDPHASIALGAMEVTLDEITAAYLPFANGGESVAPYTIEKITSRRGDILYERIPPLKDEIIAAEDARSMNFLLYQVMEGGTGRTARLGRRQAAGKTGTTNGWKDAWFVGYTGQVTTGVWVGNDDNQPMREVTGSKIPAQIWKDFMIAAHKGKPFLKLPGAYKAQSRDEELRLAGFYTQLEYDFEVAANPPQPRQQNRRRRWLPWGSRND